MGLVRGFKVRLGLLVFFCPFGAARKAKIKLLTQGFFKEIVLIFYDFFF